MAARPRTDLITRYPPRRIRAHQQLAGHLGICSARRRPGKEWHVECMKAATSTRNINVGVVE